MPAITVDNPLVLPRLATPAAEAARRARSPRSCPPTTPSKAPASRCGAPSRRRRRPRRRPVLPPRPARPGRVRPERARRRAVAPPPGLRDRHLRHRRRHRAPRLERRRRHHRRGRHPVDDRRRRDPPRRGADRDVPSATAAAPTACSSGSTCPPRLKFTPPRYQAITRDDLTLLSSPDGGALVRLIAGDLDGHAGPGATHTPITYAHASVSPGAQLEVPWNPAFSGLAYVLTGRGYAGARAPTGRRPPARRVRPRRHDRRRRRRRRSPRTRPNLEVLLLGGLPIREPIAHYGPFLMNTRQEILDAIDDFQTRPHGDHPRASLAGVSPQRQAKTGCS